METDTIKNTIAIMHATDGTSLFPLRELYPQLVTIWDELETLRETDADSVTRQEYDDLESELDDMTSDRDEAINQVTVLESDVEYMESRQAVQNNAIRTVESILRDIVSGKYASPVLSLLEQAIGLLPREE